MQKVGNVVEWKEKGAEPDRNHQVADTVFKDSSRVLGTSYLHNKATRVKVSFAVDLDKKKHLFFSSVIYIIATNFAF